MGDFETFLKVLIAIAAGIVAIGGAVTFIEHVVDRASIKSHKIEEQVNQHDHTIEKHAEYLDNDKKRLDKAEDSNRLIMRGVMQLLSHEIDGNHTTQLRETRDEMENYLINR